MGYEICIPKPRILAQEILYKYGGGDKQAVQKYIENQETEVLILAQKCYDPFEKWPKSNWNKKDNSKRK